MQSSSEGKPQPDMEVTERVRLKETEPMSRVFVGETQAGVNLFLEVDVEGEARTLRCVCTKPAGKVVNADLRGELIYERPRDGVRSITTTVMMTFKSPRLKVESGVRELRELYTQHVCQKLPTPLYLVQSNTDEHLYMGSSPFGVLTYRSDGGGMVLKNPFAIKVSAGNPSPAQIDDRPGAVVLLFTDIVVTFRKPTMSDIARAQLDSGLRQHLASVSSLWQPDRGKMPSDDPEQYLPKNVIDPVFLEPAAGHEQLAAAVREVERRCSEEALHLLADKPAVETGRLRPSVKYESSGMRELSRRLGLGKMKLIDKAGGLYWRECDMELTEGQRRLEDEFARSDVGQAHGRLSATMRRLSAEFVGMLLSEARDAAVNSSPRRLVFEDPCTLSRKLAAFFVARYDDDIKNVEVDLARALKAAATRRQWAYPVEWSVGVDVADGESLTVATIMRDGKVMFVDKFSERRASPFAAMPHGAQFIEAATPEDTAAEFVDQLFKQKVYTDVVYASQSTSEANRGDDFATFNRAELVQMCAQAIGHVSRPLPPMMEEEEGAAPTGHSERAAYDFAERVMSAYNAANTWRGESWTLDAPDFRRRVRLLFREVFQPAPATPLCERVEMHAHKRDVVANQVYFRGRDSRGELWEICTTTEGEFVTFTHTHADVREAGVTSWSVAPFMQKLSAVVFVIPRSLEGALGLKAEREVEATGGGMSFGADPLSKVSAAMPLPGTGSPAQRIAGTTMQSLRAHALNSAAPPKLVPVPDPDAFVSKAIQALASIDPAFVSGMNAGRIELLLTECFKGLEAHCEGFWREFFRARTRERDKVLAIDCAASFGDTIYHRYGAYPPDVDWFLKALYEHVMRCLAEVEGMEAGAASPPPFGLQSMIDLQVEASNIVVAAQDKFWNGRMGTHENKLIAKLFEDATLGIRRIDPDRFKAKGSES